MKWVLKNVKLLEFAGLFLLLMGWFLNWQSVQYWTDAAERLSSFVQLLTTDYQHMQITANVRLEAALNRALSVSLRDENINTSENLNKSTWNSNEVRQRWVARAKNNFFSLDQFETHLHKINDEFQLNAEKILEQGRSQLDQIDVEIKKSTNGKDVTPQEIPVPDLQLLPLEKANEIEISGMRASESMFNAYGQMENAIREAKETRLLTYNIIFILGTILISFSKLLEWRKDVRKDNA